MDSTITRCPKPVHTGDGRCEGRVEEWDDGRPAQLRCPMLPDPNTVLLIDFRSFYMDPCPCPLMAQMMDR